MFKNAITLSVCDQNIFHTSSACIAVVHSILLVKVTEMPYPYTRPERGDYRDNEDYQNDLAKWEKEERRLAQDRREAGRELAKKEWFQKLCIFLAHVVFIYWMYLIIFDPQMHAGFLAMIADKNIFIVFLKGGAVIFLVYLFCFFLAPFVAFGLFLGIFFIVITKLF